MRKNSVQLSKCFFKVISIFLVICGIILDKVVYAQQPPSVLQDSTLNNLVHPENYKTAKLGELGHIEKRGYGKRDMILIPGIGFGWDIYNEFMEANKNRYTMYALSIAGYGGTPAPPMPAEGTSYGEQTWMKAAQNAIVKLAKKLNKPVVVGNFVQGTQHALRMAIDHPDIIHSTIIIGGNAMVLPPGYIKVPTESYIKLEQRINFIDVNYAPNWFKTVTKETWDFYNYHPMAYSIDPKKGQEIWQVSADVPIQVMVRYLCEYTASDISLEFKDIKAPLLVLLPDFDEEILNNPTYNYFKPLFIDCWDSRGIEGNIRNFAEVKIIKDSHLFLMVDQSEKLNKVIYEFVSDEETRMEQRLRLANLKLEELKSNLKKQTIPGLQEYVGQYEDRTIILEKGALFFKSRDDQQYGLAFISKDEFSFVILPTIRVKFARDSSGKIIELHLYQSGKWNILKRNG